MYTKYWGLVVMAFISSGIAHALDGPIAPTKANRTNSLQGVVRSEEEGPMEGVLVSAKKDGSTITVTVSSDEQGHYQFPAKRLVPGHYTLAIRAVGFDLLGTGSVDVVNHKVTQADLKLTKTKNLEGQLSNAEWLMSVPGTDDEKSLLLNCLECHSLNLPIESTHSTDEFIQVLSRMATYAGNSQPAFPQPFAKVPPFDSERFREAAKYLSSINRRANGTWSYAFETLPRIKGRGTHFIITEYALPRAISQPHDVIVDAHGDAWYTDHGQPFIGRLDPKTGAVKEFPVPILKPGSPIGELNIENGRDGQLWFGMHFQGGIAQFDTKTEKLRIFPLPPDLQEPLNFQSMMVAADHEAVDGRIWNSYSGNSLVRLDVAAGTFEQIFPFGRNTPKPSGPGLVMTMSPKAPPLAEGSLGLHFMYGIASDSHDNLFTTDFLGRDIYKIDAKTEEVTAYPTSTVYSRPRRGHMDAEDRFWFAEYNANRIGMLDTKTGQMKEWSVPTPWTAPYDVQIDRNDEAWTAGMSTDRVVRINTRTGDIVEYPLPKPTNVRRVFVDNRTNPVSFWIGSNHGAAIMKLEPLD